MPMTNAGLKSQLKIEIGNLFDIADPAILDKACEAIATAVVTYIKANATVVPTLLVAPPGGGPVTGTGTVT